MPLTCFSYNTAVGIDISMIVNDIWRLADQEVLTACGSLWQPAAPVWGSPRPPINTFPLIRCFGGSVVRCLDAGGWLELSAGGWLMLSEL